MKTDEICLTYSLPLEITTDGTVLSSLSICNPAGFAVIIKANNVTLQECDISGVINICGAVHGIVIQNNYIHDVMPIGDRNYIKNFAGITTTECAFEDNCFMQPSGAYDITVRGNYFEDCPTGTYLVGCKGPITFRGNYSRNHFGPFPRGQMVQLALCDGSTGPILIENNFSYVDPDDPARQAMQPPAPAWKTTSTATIPMVQMLIQSPSAITSLPAAATVSAAQASCWETAVAAIIKYSTTEFITPGTLALVYAAVTTGW